MYHRNFSSTPSNVFPKGATLHHRRFLAFSQNTCSFHFNVIMNRHSICHVTQTGFVGKHVFGLSLFVNRGFSYTNLCAVFSSHIHFTRLTVHFDRTVVIRFKHDRIFFTKHLIDAMIKKVIVRIYLMLHQCLGYVTKV